MDKRKNWGDINVHLPGLTLLLPVISASIKHHIPRLYQLTDQSAEPNGLPSALNTEGGPNEIEIRPLSSSSSESDLESVFSDAQRPATSCSTSTGQASECTAERRMNNKETCLPDEIADRDIADPVNSKYEAISGLRWSRVIPGMMHYARPYGISKKTLSQRNLITNLAA